MLGLCPFLRWRRREKDETSNQTHIESGITLCGVLRFSSRIFCGWGIISRVIGNTLEYPSPLNSPLLGTSVYLHFAFAMAASAVGLYALYRKKDRALLVYLAIPWGIFLFLGVVTLLIGVLLGPPQT